MNMINISIIIPVYNVCRYIDRCLHSVVNQECDEVHIECILVDDLGTDNSMEIVHQIIDDYHGPIDFKVITHDKNRGVSLSRNTGLQASTGDYVFFMDSDDYLLPYAIKSMVDGLKAYPDVDMVIGNVRNEKENSPLMKWLKEPYFIDNGELIMSEMFRGRLNKYAWNKLMRKSMVIPFDGSIRLIEDVLWTYQMLQRVSSVLLLPQETYNYTNNPLSIVNTTTSGVYVDKNVSSYTRLCRYMLENPLSEQKYGCKLQVDYLLFVGNNLLQGVDIMFKGNASPTIANDLLRIRKAYFMKTLRYRRFLVTFFSLLMYKPFYYLFFIPFIRHQYFRMERLTCIMSHLFDFLHI